MRRILGCIGMGLMLIPAKVFASGMLEGEWVACASTRLNAPYYALVLGPEGRARMSWRLRGADDVTAHRGRYQIDAERGTLSAEFTIAERSRIVFVGAGWRRDHSAGALFGSFLVQSRNDDAWQTENGFPVTLVPQEHDVHLHTGKRDNSRLDVRCPSVGS